jgi:hypothetical protein
VVALVAVAALGVAAAANASFDRSPPPNPVEQDLQRQINALIAVGVPLPDDPKVEMLRQQPARLRTGDTADPPPEHGVNTAMILAGTTTTSAPAVTPQAAPGATTTATGDWQSGKVQCEEVPGLLSAAELAQAAWPASPARRHHPLRGGQPRRHRAGRSVRERRPGPPPARHPPAGTGSARRRRHPDAPG